MTEETESVMVDINLRVDSDTLKSIHHLTQGREGYEDTPEQVLQLLSDHVVCLVLAARMVGVDDYSKVMKAAAEHGERMAVLAEEKAAEQASAA